MIVVADRSRSMPAAAHANIHELIRNLANNRGPGDQLALVTFGSRVQIKQTLSNTALMKDYTKEILPDGSDLNEAVNVALNLVETDRPARILVFSDGEAKGASPLSAARRAREAGVPVDFRVFERIRIGDVAVESVLLPETVSSRDPFQFSVWIYADKDAHGSVKLVRDGREIVTTEHDFTAGMNRLMFGVCWKSADSTTTASSSMSRTIRCWKTIEARA